MRKQKSMQGYFLFFGVLMWASGCLSAPTVQLPENTREMDLSEHLFRYLMAETNMVGSQKKGCLVFGNPLQTPSAQFLARFNDLDDKLIRLQQIHQKGSETGYRDRAGGSPVIFYQIIKMIRLGQDTYLMEGGWICCRKHPRRCLYEVAMDDTGCYIREIRVFDRCRHVIISHSGTTGPQFFSRRLAF